MLIKVGRCWINPSFIRFIDYGEIHLDGHCLRPFGTIDSDEIVKAINLGIAGQSEPDLYKEIILLKKEISSLKEEYEVQKDKAILLEAELAGLMAEAARKN